MRAETCNYRDGVMRAGWGGPLHSGGLIPRLILCVCVFVCVSFPPEGRETVSTG